MKTANVGGRECIYHFDFVRINNKNQTKTLKKILPLDELRKECHKVRVEPAYSMARQHGYRSNKIDRDALKLVDTMQNRCHSQ